MDIFWNDTKQQCQASLSQTYFLVILPSAALLRDFLQLSSDTLGAVLSSSMIRVSPDRMSSDDNELPLSCKLSCFGGNPERT